MAPDVVGVPPDNAAYGRSGSFVDNRRVGMGRHFADEDSLTNPDDFAAIQNYWYPIHFMSRLAKVGGGVRVESNPVDI
jgi:hypothetical protein